MTVYSPSLDGGWITSSSEVMDIGSAGGGWRDVGKSKSDVSDYKQIAISRGWEMK